MGSLVKAWTVRAYCLEGAAYCVECAENGDALISGNPVFVSDHFEYSECDSCGGAF
jgi:hypothetical protein